MALRLATAALVGAARFLSSATEQPVEYNAPSVSEYRPTAGKWPSEGLTFGDSLMAGKGGCVIEGQDDGGYGSLLLEEQPSTGDVLPDGLSYSKEFPLSGERSDSFAPLWGDPSRRAELSDYYTLSGGSSGWKMPTTSSADAHSGILVGRDYWKEKSSWGWRPSLYYESEEGVERDDVERDDVDGQELAAGLPPVEVTFTPTLLPSCNEEASQMELKEGPPFIQSSEGEIVAHADQQQAIFSLLPPESGKGASNDMPLDAGIIPLNEGLVSLDVKGIVNLGQDDTADSRQVLAEEETARLNSEEDVKSDPAGSGIDARLRVNGVQPICEQYTYGLLDGTIDMLGGELEPAEQSVGDLFAGHDGIEISRESVEEISSTFKGQSTVLHADASRSSLATTLEAAHEISPFADGKLSLASHVIGDGTLNVPLPLGNGSDQSKRSSLLVKDGAPNALSSIIFEAKKDDSKTRTMRSQMGIFGDTNLYSSPKEGSIGNQSEFLSVPQAEEGSIVALSQEQEESSLTSDTLVAPPKERTLRRSPVMGKSLVAVPCDNVHEERGLPLEQHGSRDMDDNEEVLDLDGALTGVSFNAESEGHDGVLEIHAVVPFQAPRDKLQDAMETVVGSGERRSDIIEQFNSSPSIQPTLPVDLSIDYTSHSAPWANSADESEGEKEELSDGNEASENDTCNSSWSPFDHQLGVGSSDLTESPLHQEPKMHCSEHVPERDRLSHFPASFGRVAVTATHVNQSDASMCPRQFVSDAGSFDGDYFNPVAIRRASTHIGGENLETVSLSINIGDHVANTAGEMAPGSGKATDEMADPPKEESADYTEGLQESEAGIDYTGMGDDEACPTGSYSPWYAMFGDEQVTHPAKEAFVGGISESSTKVGPYGFALEKEMCLPSMEAPLSDNSSGQGTVSKKNRPAAIPDISTLIVPIEGSIKEAASITQAPGGRLPRVVDPESPVPFESIDSAEGNSASSGVSVHAPLLTLLKTGPPSETFNADTGFNEDAQNSIGGTSAEPLSTPLHEPTLFINPLSNVGTSAGSNDIHLSSDGKVRIYSEGERERLAEDLGHVVTQDLTVDPAIISASEQGDSGSSDTEHPVLSDVLDSTLGPIERERGEKDSDKDSLPVADIGSASTQPAMKRCSSSRLSTSQCGYPRKLHNIGHKICLPRLREGRNQTRQATSQFGSATFGLPAKKCPRRGKTQMESLGTFQLSFRRPGFGGECNARNRTYARQALHDAEEGPAFSENFSNVQDDDIQVDDDAQGRKDAADSDGAGKGNGTSAKTGTVALLGTTSAIALDAFLSRRSKGGTTSTGAMSAFSKLKETRERHASIADKHASVIVDPPTLVRKELRHDYICPKSKSDDKFPELMEVLRRRTSKQNRVAPDPGKRPKQPGEAKRSNSASMKKSVASIKARSRNGMPRSNADRVYTPQVDDRKVLPALALQHHLRMSSSRAQESTPEPPRLAASKPPPQAARQQGSRLLGALVVGSFSISAAAVTASGVLWIYYVIQA